MVKNKFIDKPMATNRTNKFNIDNTKKQVRLKHGERFQKELDVAEGNPQMLKKAWEKLAAEFDDKFNCKYLKTNIINWSLNMRIREASP